MNSADVIHLYTSLEKAGVEIWIDGGWGVDALLGEQTRPPFRFLIAAASLRVVERKNLPPLRGWGFLVGPFDPTAYAVG